MLFLGAGASKPVGIPTMKEFTQAVLKDMKRRGADYESLVASIQASISKYGIEPDIEAVLTILDGKLNPRRSLDNLAAQQITFPADSRGDEKGLALLAMDEIQTSIYQICIGVVPQIATNVYSKLWETISAPFSIRYSESSPGSRTGLEAGALVRRIFTTNYDLSMEIFLKSKRISFDEGFRQDSYGAMSFANEYSEDQVRLVKLHGSINYYLMDSGKVVKSNAPLGNTDIYNERVDEQMMIYPMGEKYATRLPFYEALGQLRSALFSELFCLVIGYSFRDVAINNAFIDAVRVNPRLTVLLVSPSANRIRETLDPKIQPAVHTLEASLGNEPLPQSIAERISDLHPPMYPKA